MLATGGAVVLEEWVEVEVHSAHLIGLASWKAKGPVVYVWLLLHGLSELSKGIESVIAVVAGDAAGQSMRECYCC